MSQVPTQMNGTPPAQASDITSLLQNLLQAQNANAGGGAMAGRMAAPLPVASAFGGFAPQPQMMVGGGGLPAATAVHIPIKIPIGQGSVKVMLTFGPEFAEPNALMNLIGALCQSGVPVDIYVPKQQFGGNGYGNGGGYRNGYGNGGGGGYNGGGGGWGRR